VKDEVSMKVRYPVGCISMIDCGNYPEVDDAGGVQMP
jgi:hypothetical protein